MTEQDSTKRVGRAASNSSGYATCADCGNPLTDSEHFRGDACERCERDYLLDTTSNVDDDLYPRAA